SNSCTRVSTCFPTNNLVLFYLLYLCYCYHIVLHSFPTRRSSDLKKRPACSELRWAYCNHKATYFASYLTGGDCVPDDQNTWPYRSEERFSRNAETDLVCRLLLEKKKKNIA